MRFTLRQTGVPLPMSQQLIDQKGNFAPAPIVAATELPNWLVGAAALMFVANVLAAGWNAPMWLDETFSAAIAAQPDVSHLIDWCLHELSGPVYYTMLWLWEKLAGDGDVALRLPSAAIALAAPLLLWWRGHPDKVLRRYWALVAALWMPGFAFATEARPYTLMFLLGCVQAIAFLRLMAAPSVGRATAWVVASALAVLTHYHAMVISGLQGLVYLAWWRRRALATWPASIALVPMATWMWLHLPVVLRFAASGVWYTVWPPSQVSVAPALLFGNAVAGSTLSLAILGSLALWLRHGKGTRPALWVSREELLLVATGLSAFAIVFATAFIRPSFNPRYLLPYMPAIFFGVALWLREVSRAMPLAPLAVLGGMTALAIQPLAERIEAPRDDHRYAFNIEQPSDWIVSQGAGRQLVFFWDNPVTANPNVQRLGEVGGFFLRRHGLSVDVVIPHPALEGDPNPLVERLAGDDPNTAIIWIYDANVPGTRALRFTPRLSSKAVNRHCRDFGKGVLHVLACVRA